MHSLGDILAASALPIGAIGGILAAYWARGSKRHAQRASAQSTMANTAVNNTIGEQHSLISMVRDNENTQAELLALLGALKMDNDETHSRLIHELQAVVPRGRGDRKLYEKIDDLKLQLQAHVDWEEGREGVDGKYSQLQAEIAGLKLELEESLKKNRGIG